LALAAGKARTAVGQPGIQTVGKGVGELGDQGGACRLGDLVDGRVRSGVAGVTGEGAREQKGGSCTRRLNLPGAGDLGQLGVAGARANAVPGHRGQHHWRKLRVGPRHRGQQAGEMSTAPQRFLS
jgi:hypothetical protein